MIWISRATAYSLMSWLFILTWSDQWAGCQNVTVRSSKHPWRETILGAISSFGVVSVKVKRPYEASSNKRKLPGTSNDIRNTGHYFTFYWISWISTNRSRTFTLSWKGERLLQQDTLRSRIQKDTCSRFLYSNLRGFCRYTESKCQVRFDKRPTLMLWLIIYTKKLWKFVSNKERKVSYAQKINKNQMNTSFVDTADTTTIIYVWIK